MGVLIRKFTIHWLAIILWRVTDNLRNETNPFLMHYNRTTLNRNTTPTQRTCLNNFNLKGHNHSTACIRSPSMYNRKNVITSFPAAAFTVSNEYTVKYGLICKTHVIWNFECADISYYLNKVIYSK